MSGTATVWVEIGFQFAGSYQRREEDTGTPAGWVGVECQGATLSLSKWENGSRVSYDLPFSLSDEQMKLITDKLADQASEEMTDE
jgi:hypothetical protein